SRSVIVGTDVPGGIADGEKIIAAGIGNRAGFKIICIIITSETDAGEGGVLLSFHDAVNQRGSFGELFNHTAHIGSRDVHLNLILWPHISAEQQGGVRGVDLPLPSDKGQAEGSGCVAEKY